MEKDWLMSSWLRHPPKASLGMVNENYLNFRVKWYRISSNGSKSIWKNSNLNFPSQNKLPQRIADDSSKSTIVNLWAGINKRKSFENRLLIHIEIFIVFNDVWVEKSRIRWRKNLRKVSDSLVISTCFQLHFISIFHWIFFSSILLWILNRKFIRLKLKLAMTTSIFNMKFEIQMNLKNLLISIKISIK